MRCGPAPWYGFRAGTEFMPLVSGWADFVHAYAAVLGQSITSEDADRVPGGKSNFLPGIFHIQKKVQPPTEAVHDAVGTPEWPSGAHVGIKSHIDRNFYDAI